MTGDCVSFTYVLAVKHFQYKKMNDPGPIFNTLVVLVGSTGNKYNLALFNCPTSVFVVALDRDGLSVGEVGWCLVMYLFF